MMDDNSLHIDFDLISDHIHRLRDVQNNGTKKQAIEASIELSQLKIELFKIQQEFDGIIDEIKG